MIYDMYVYPQLLFISINGRTDSWTLETQDFKGFLSWVPSGTTCLLKFEDAGCPVPGPSPVFDCSVSLKDFARAARLMYVAYACHRKPSVSFQKIFHGVSYCLHPVFGKFGVIPRSNVNLGLGFFGSYGCEIL